MLEATYKKQFKNSFKENMKSGKSIGESFSEVAEEVKEYNREISKIKDQIPTNHDVIVLIDKVTTYQLGKILEKQGGHICCITPEGSIFKGSLISKDAAPELFNRLHMQEPYNFENRNTSISLKKPGMNIIALVQEEIAKSIFGNNALSELGVCARFLPYLYKYTDNDISSISHQWYDFRECKDIYNNMIIRLLRLYYTQDSNAERYTVRLEDDAIDEIHKFENYIKNDIIPYSYEKAIPALRKLHGHALRIAFAIHVINNENPYASPILKSEVDLACDICECLLPYIDYVYNPMGLQAYADAVKIIDCLHQINTLHGYDNAYDGNIDSRAIQQRSPLDKPRTENALRRLSSQNILRIVDWGASNKRIIVHPDFFHSKLY